jgi:hypothetical protein
MPGAGDAAEGAIGAEDDGDPGAAAAEGWMIVAGAGGMVSGRFGMALPPGTPAGVNDWPCGSSSTDVAALVAGAAVAAPAEGIPGSCAVDDGGTPALPPDCAPTASITAP